MFKFKNIAQAFSMKGTPISCSCFGSGHINDTYMITTSYNFNYILQRINQNVFKNPIQVMENAYNITSFIKGRGGMALTFLLNKDGKPYYCDKEGNVWRAYEFLGGLCLDVADNAEDFYQSGVAFGQFQHQLSDYPAHTLVETIPNFHNTPDRIHQLKLSIDRDVCGRLHTCQEEVMFFLDYEYFAGTLTKMLEDDVLPLRVTHNDTKLNNVLLNPETHEPLCVLDLDTVMPGLSAYDFGDAIRFGAATAAEDEQDASKMKLDMKLFEAFTRGFLTGAPNLTDSEKKALPLGAFTITLECGSRFLKDYLDGDVYFKTKYPNHNLVRCRTQIALCRDMIVHWDEMNATITRIAEEASK